MADKISTVVLKVDLECARCYRKMRKVLCKIQDKMNIKTISFDEKSNAVTVSGPFDPDKLCRKLCCEAGRVIKEMHVNGKEQKADKDGGGDEKQKAPKDAGKADKDGGKPEKPKDGGGKADKEKPKDAAAAKPEKKVKFDDAPPATDAKPGKAMPPLPAGMSMADLGPLLEKMKQAKQQGPPMMAPPVAAQGVAVPSIWPAPAGPMSYSYDPTPYGQPAQPSYYGGGCAGGYYGVPVHDHQGWYHGNWQPYYQQQQPYCGEDPNAGCSVM